jgi:hypothetical protein
LVVAVEEAVEEVHLRQIANMVEAEESIPTPRVPQL